MKRLSLISLMLVLGIFVSFAQTIEGISLGDLEFVKPSASTAMAGRSLKMKMATAGLSPKFYAKIGGVAFVQTATPEFDIRSFDLGCDYNANKAYLVVNDNKIDIPLEVWQLVPIVEYASDNDNAAVTLYGEGDAPVRFHPAFIDEMLGLRLLQTDLMLASAYLDPMDRGSFPVSNTGEVLISEQEKNVKSALDIYYSIIVDEEMDYEMMSLYSSYAVMTALDSLDESYNTYIFTDYETPITFYIEDGEIKFNGTPYYRFAYSTPSVDVFETYPEFENGLDSLFERKAKYADSRAKHAFDKADNKVLYSLSEDVASGRYQENPYYLYDKLDYQVANPLFAMDTLAENFLFLNAIMQSYAEGYIYESDSLGVRDEKYVICKEVMDLTSETDIYAASLLVEYVNLILEEDLTDSTAFFIAAFASEMNLSNENILRWHIWRNRESIYEECSEITEYFKADNTYYYMNPIVYDAAYNTCHWAALFRYVKDNYPKQWNEFATEVKGLEYEVPDVWTPVKLERREDYSYFE